MACRNETYTTATITSKEMFVECERSGVTPTMATRGTTVDMAVKWKLIPQTAN
jgi:hypothetical protein